MKKTVKVFKNGLSVETDPASTEFKTLPNKAIDG